MEKLKFALIAIVTLSLLGLLGYWSVRTLQSGTDYKASQKIQQLEQENKDLKTEVANLTAELNIAQSKLKLEEPAQNVVKEPEPTVYKYQDLITQLQKLVTNKTVLKLKSKGGAVGTVQKFLNIYNKTSNPVDNDYGAATLAAVKDFQKDEGLSATGEAGSATFNKMIDWLKEQE